MVRRFETVIYLAILTVFSLLIAGCAGTATLVPNNSELVRQLVGPSGATLRSADGSFELTVPNGALTREVLLTVEVFETPLPGMSWPGWTIEPRPIRVAFDSSAMHATASIQAQLNLPSERPTQPEAYLIGMSGAERTATGYRRAGIFHALREETSTNRLVRGHISKRDVQACELDPDVGFVVFSAARPRGVQDSQFLAELYNFNGQQFTGVVPNLAGKRVAVMVHGVASSLADILPLAQFVASVKMSGDTTPYYDAVIGYQYTSNASISVIGQGLADLAKPAIAGATEVDVYAHSMGNLVARYALETPTLTNRLGSVVNHYVSLAGPHDGVPFADLRWFRTLLLIFPESAKLCLEDLMTLGIGGAGLTPFLGNLNTTSQGPDYATARYYSASGNNHNLDIQGFKDAGAIINWIYSEVAGNEVPNDGLVAVYSAQSQVLARQSQTWSVGPTFYLTHPEFHSSPIAFNQIQDWINGW